MINATHAISRVTTEDAATVVDLLDSAMEGLIPVALALNRGIKVTRIGAGDYTVETAADVPCGYTIYEH
jgi:hypothetical protein